MYSSFSEGNVPQLPGPESYAEQPLIAPLSSAVSVEGDHELLAVAEELGVGPEDLEPIDDLPELDPEVSDLVEAVVEPYGKPYATPQLEGRDAAADARERAAQQAKLDALHDESVLRNEERAARWGR